MSTDPAPNTDVGAGSEAMSSEIPVLCTTTLAATSSAADRETDDNEPSSPQQSSSPTIEPTPASDKETDGNEPSSPQQSSSPTNDTATAGSAADIKTDGNEVSISHQSSSAITQATSPQDTSMHDSVATEAASGTTKDTAKDNSSEATSATHIHDIVAIGAASGNNKDTTTSPSAARDVPKGLVVHTAGCLDNNQAQDAVPPSSRPPKSSTDGKKAKDSPSGHAPSSAQAKDPSSSPPSSAPPRGKQLLSQSATTATSKVHIKREVDSGDLSDHTAPSSIQSKTDQIETIDLCTPEKSTLPQGEPTVSTTPASPVSQKKVPDESGVNNNGDFDDEDDEGGAWEDDDVYEQTWRAEGEAKALQNHIDNTYQGLLRRGFRFTAKTLANADHFAAKLGLIPAGHLPHRTSADELLCGLEAAADFLCQISNKKSDCPVHLQAAKAHILAKLRRNLHDPLQVDRRAEYLRQLSGLSAEDWAAVIEVDDFALRETEFLSVQTIFLLLVMEFQDSDLPADCKGFELYEIHYNRSEDCIQSIFDQQAYGTAHFKFFLRLVDGVHWEAIGPVNGMGEVSNNGRALTITPFMKWASPLYNGQKIRIHTCGPTSMDELRAAYVKRIASAQTACLAKPSVHRPLEVRPQSPKINEQVAATFGHAAASISDVIDSTTTVPADGCFGQPQGQKRSAASPTATGPPAKGRRISKAKPAAGTAAPPSSSPPPGGHRRSVSAKPTIAAKGDKKQSLHLDSLLVSELDAIRSPDRFILATQPEIIRICHLSVHPGHISLPLPRIPYALLVDSLNNPDEAAAFRAIAVEAFCGNVFYMDTADSALQAHKFHVLLSKYSATFSTFLPDKILHVRIRNGKSKISGAASYVKQLQMVRELFEYASVEIEVPVGEIEEGAKGILTQKSPKLQWTTDPEQLFADNGMSTSRES